MLHKLRTNILEGHLTIRLFFRDWKVKRLVKKINQKLEIQALKDRIKKAKELPLDIKILSNTQAKTKPGVELKKGLKLLNDQTKKMFNGVLDLSNEMPNIEKEIL